MFKARLLTSLVLVPLVLGLIFYANMWVLGAIILLLVVLGGWEWLQLVPVQKPLNKGLFIAALLFLVYVCFYSLTFWLVAGLVLWAFILLAVVAYPKSEKWWGYPCVVGGACLLLLPLFANTLAGIYQHEQGSGYILYVLCLVWAADIGAYLAGKACGRHKLIPLVSPGKTLEGSFGGVLGVIGVATIGFFYFKPGMMGYWYALAIGTGLISMLGDLFISMLKRRSKLKDTGRIFPGHGGLLDRLDSLIAAAPFFYCGLSCLGH